jgi:hypothetical protein
MSSTVRLGMSSIDVANAGSLVRDLTGLATIGAAQAALLTRAEGATAAGQRALQNLAAAIQREIEVARIAASVFGAGPIEQWTALKATSGFAYCG